MSEKKILNEEELDKVTGGFYTTGDSRINTEGQIYYYKSAFKIKKSLKVQILNCGIMENKYNSGNKMYLCNIDNGWLKGWLPANCIDNKDNPFQCKDAIEWSCISESGIYQYDIDANNYFQ